MGIIVHHKPVNNESWNMHVWLAAWDGNKQWPDGKASPSNDVVDFQLPEAPDEDPRKLQFKFYYRSLENGTFTWEDDAFIRRLFLTSQREVWTFADSPRILYQNPFPAGVVFNSGDVLTFQVITKNAYRAGNLYVWDPYNSQNAPAFFTETERDDSQGISTFKVPLQPWMISGFNLKLMHGSPEDKDHQVWEPDASNRVWRPCDGAFLWLKSGQCDLRSQPLSLTPVTLEVMYSASISTPPQLTLKDLAENLTFPVKDPLVEPYSGSSIFNVATYTVPIYHGASYAVISSQSSQGQALENPPIQRLFPADPSVPDSVSRFVLGASDWVVTFPVVKSIPLSIQPHLASSFKSGLSVQVSVGNCPQAYETIKATQQLDGTWQATLNVAMNTPAAIDLLPTAGAEPKPYDWIDTSRYFTPTDSMPKLYTTEGVYGVCALRATEFAEPPDRAALMKAAFGSAIVDAGIFAAREMPHGATILGDQVYFAVHAPHAVSATLILVDDSPGKLPSRKPIGMTLTNDTFYWWCSLPALQSPPGTRYRFLLNDNIEVLDPAARAVLDRGTENSYGQTSFGEDPADPSTSWSIVLDVEAIRTAAYQQPWQTMGWENFLIYEIHAMRFTNLQSDTLKPFALLADELNATSRLGQPGYLHQLPIKVFGLLPVNQFRDEFSWGYDPAFYFAIDDVYGGAQGLASFVNAAHASGRGVTLDVVFNHSLGSPLMSIARDVYRNGDYDGDRMNCGHPMVKEYFRQASVYLFRTFHLDGFRFDDTQTIATKCEGGWEFLGMIRSSLRAAASAEGRRWPYCVAENAATKPFDICDPNTGVMDGQWATDEIYRIKDASYDNWHPGSDDSQRLKDEMDNPKPKYFGYPRPFFQATRSGETHDLVSEQDPSNKRIAARPPFRQGYQMAKALGTLTLLSNGIPMLFMGQEVGETFPFSFDFSLKNGKEYINPQVHDRLPATDNTRLLAWFRQLMGLRNDPSKGLQGDANYQVVATGNRTVAFSCGSNQRLFVVVTFGTPNQQQNSSWLGLPASSPYNEIFNSSWPDFQVEFEHEQTNGGYSAQIYSGQIINLPWIGAVVLERN